MSTENKHLKDTSTWKRILFMIAFAIAYNAAEVVLIVIVIAQLGFKLLTGNTNEQLITFGNQLSQYVFAIFKYLTFNTEERPFPFSSWPAIVKK